MPDQRYNDFYQSLQNFDGNCGDPVRVAFQNLLDNIKEHNEALYQVYDAVTRIYELRDTLPRGLILDLWENARRAKIDNLNLKLIADVFRHGYLNIQALLWADCHQSPNADLSNWFPHMLNVLHRFAEAAPPPDQQKALIREFCSVVNLQQSVYRRDFIDINHITEILNGFQQYEELGVAKDGNYLFPNITNRDTHKGTDDQKIAFLMCLSYLLTFSYDQQGEVDPIVKTDFSRI